MNYYLVLEIPMDADDEMTRRAFRKLARRYHPDAGPGSSADKFREILEAYEVLRDPMRRSAYDASLRSMPRKARQIVEPLRPEPTRARQKYPGYRPTIEDFFDEWLSVFDDRFF
jgi:curved DNA-binding protein CbpA